MTSYKRRPQTDRPPPQPWPPEDRAVESEPPPETQAAFEAPDRQTHIFSREPVPERERIGDILRRAREERGESLYVISDILRIRPTFLAALENSRYDEFAADAYVTGFLRTYAEYLGLNTKAAIDVYRREMTGRRRKPQLNMPKPISEGRAPTVAILIGATMAALLLYALWYGISSSSRTAIETGPALPQTAESAQTEFLPAPAIDNLLMTDPKASPGISLSSSPPAITLPVETPEKAEGKKPEQEKEKEKLGAPVKLTPGAAKESPEKARVVVRATKESWVLITDDQGNTIVDKIMEAGETYNVPPGKGLRLTAGNGDGVIISLDGVDLPKLGTDSRIVRDIPLE